MLDRSYHPRFRVLAPRLIRSRLLIYKVVASSARIFGSRSGERGYGEASDVAVDATNHLREVLELIERVIEDA